MSGYGVVWTDELDVVSEEICDNGMAVIRQNHRFLRLCENHKNGHFRIFGSSTYFICISQVLISHQYKKGTSTTP